MANPQALPDKNKLVAEIEKYFDSKIVNQIAKETHFVQRESKLSGMDFFLLCVFAHQKDESISLEGLCAELLKQGISITKQSLQDRFNDNSSAFMEKMAARILSQKLDMPPIIRHQVFSRIIIGDSTVFQLPEGFAGKYRGSGGGASNAAVKMQYGYDLLSHDIHAMLVEQGVNPDSNMCLGDVKKTIYE